MKTVLPSLPPLHPNPHAKHQTPTAHTRRMRMMIRLYYAASMCVSSERAGHAKTMLDITLNLLLDLNKTSPSSRWQHICLDLQLWSRRFRPAGRLWPWVYRGCQSTSRISWVAYKSFSSRCIIYSAHHIKTTIIEKKTFKTALRPQHTKMWCRWHQCHITSGGQSGVPSLTTVMLKDVSTASCTVIMCASIFEEIKVEESWNCICLFLNGQLWRRQQKKLASQILWVEW